MGKYAPYLLGSILFILSAARFLAQNDLVGATISGIAGIFAIIFLIVRKK